MWKILCYKILFLMLAFLLLTNCSEKGEKVKKINNPSKGRWADDESKMVHLSLELTLGGLDAVENQIFQCPRSITVDKNGDILILDSRANQIHRFDRNGQFLDIIGRTGQGPGEFQVPYDITLKENKLYVADLGNRRVHCFDNTGKYISDFLVRGNFTRITVDSKEDLYIPYYTDEFLVHKYSKDGELLNSFVETKTAPMKGDDRLQRAYNSLSIAADQNDNIYVAYNFQNRIQKYNSKGKLLLEFERELPFKPAPIHIFRNAGGGSGIRGDKIYSDIYIGPKGLVYVLLGKYFSDKGRIIDRYNSNGEYLDSFWTGIQCYRFVINSHNLYLLDSFDSLKMYKYSMIR